MRESPPCLHCAIWRAIADHLHDHEASDLIAAIAEVAADVLASAPAEALLAAKPSFAVQVAGFVAQKRAAGPQAPADADRAGATLQ